MKISVKVPATTANIGPGFDCMGMALPIYNTITIEETVLPGTGVEINVIADSDTIDQLSLDHVPCDENSIVYKEEDKTTSKIELTNQRLRRENEKIFMEYTFDEEKETKGIVTVKSLQKTLELNLKTRKIDKENQNIEINYVLENDEYKYKLEVI